MERHQLNDLTYERRKLLNSLAKQDLEQLEKRTIFVIDDCEDNLNIIRKYFNQVENVYVEGFQDEYIAIKRFMQDKPDLVILDINLTEINGFKVDSILRNLSFFNIPTIFMSTDVSNELIFKEDNRQNNHYFIPKPLSKRKLLNTVNFIFSLDNRTKYFG